MQNLLTYQATETDQGRMIRSILARDLGLSQALVKRLKEGDRIQLNGVPVRVIQRVIPGDLLTVDIGFREETSVTPEPMKLDIIYEDADFLVLNKPPGILIHPIGKQTSGTLANGVIYYWQQKGILARFRPIHRLDRNTSGLVVIGKNQFAHQSLYKQFNRRTVIREYIALATGRIPEGQGTIVAPIARKPGSIIERCVDPSGQESTTHYRVLKYLPEMTLVSLTLETGRTHQIRVHLSHIGNPILGDTLYGGSDLLINRQALHSHAFQFTHPRSGASVRFTAPLATDIKELVDEADAHFWQ